MVSIIANKKVLIITPFDKDQRGNSITTARLLVGLTSRGFQIDRLSLERENWQEYLKDALAKSKYALIHGFHARYFGEVLQAIPQMRNIPLILTTTGTDIHCDLLGEKRSMILDTFQTVQKIVVFNDDFHQIIQDVYPGFQHPARPSLSLAEKLVTIPQGVFLEPGAGKNRGELGLSEDQVVFLLPSGLRRIKHIELAIDSLSAVQDEFPEVRLLIMGAAIEENYTRKILNRMRGLDWVIYLEEIPHSEMMSVLRLGDIVINTSYCEGQPQGALEAMSLGKPCILTGVPGNLNIIEQGVEGFYVGNQEELVKDAKILVQDPVERHLMGQRAAQLTASKFTLGQELDAYSRIYRQFLRQARD